MRAAFRRFLWVGLLCLGYSSFAAATTMLYLSGSEGEWITGGETFSYSGSEGYFTAYRSTPGYVHLRFNTNDRAHYWDFSIGGPIVNGTFTGPLLTGLRYDVDANWQMANVGSANLGFAGDYRTYNTVKGGFTLYDLVIENNLVKSLALQFDFISAEFAGQSVSGYVWMNSNAALPPDFPNHLSVPEPATAGLLLFGLLGLGIMKRQRQA